MVLLGVEKFGNVFAIQVVLVCMLVFAADLHALACVLWVVAGVVGFGALFQGSAEDCVALGGHFSLILFIIITHWGYR